VLIRERDGPFLLAVRREGGGFDGGDTTGVVRFKIHDIGLGCIVGQAVDVEVVDIEEVIVLLTAALEADGCEGDLVDRLLRHAAFFEKLGDIKGDGLNFTGFPCVVFLLVQLVALSTGLEEGVGIDGAVGGRKDEME